MAGYPGHIVLYLKTYCIIYKTMSVYEGKQTKRV